MTNRVILIVLDSLGVGYSKDAGEFGDTGANTLGHIIENNPNLRIPNLKKLGIGKLPGIADLIEGGENQIEGCYGRMTELSKGKDTTTGHWEIAGIETKVPFNTYPNGFPKDFIKAFEKKIGRKTIGNVSISGTEILQKLGEHHEQTGDVIIYTSEDSVFQIAANVEIISLEELYNICKIAREMLVGKWTCGRVIARPYKLEHGERIRTADRHDYSIDPHEETMLDIIKESDKKVYAIGKINDIFNGKGVTETISTKDNMDGVDKMLQIIKAEFEGVIFVNLVDFDSKFGHRRNVVGYGNAIEEFDKRLPEIIKESKENDIIMICADHGNDPTFEGFNHTREYVPLLVKGKNIKEDINLGTRDTFADIAATICEYLGVRRVKLGKSFLEDIK